MGGEGVISVMANIIPKDTHELYARFMAGDIKGAQALQLKVLDLVKALFIETSPVPVKEAMNALGMQVGGCRLPLVPMEAPHKELLLKALQNYGLFNK